MIVQSSRRRVNSSRELLLLVAFLLVNAPNCHLSLVLAYVVQGDAVNCNSAEWSRWLDARCPQQAGWMSDAHNKLQYRNYYSH